MLVTIITASLLVFSVSASVVDGSRYRIIEEIEPEIASNGDKYFTALNNDDRIDSDDILMLVVSSDIFSCEDGDSLLEMSENHTIIGTLSYLDSYEVYECSDLASNHSEFDICEECWYCGCIGEILVSDWYSSSDTRLYIVEPDKATIGDLVTDMFSSFGDTVNGLASGVKDMFSHILWNDGTTSSGLSGFAKFGFVMAGLSLALGLGYVIISKIGR